MGHNSHIDFELHERIEDLVASGLLDQESDAYRISQQVIDTTRGYRSLSEKQKYIYDSVVVPALKRRDEQLERQRILDNNPD